MKLSEKIVEEIEKWFFRKKFSTLKLFEQRWDSFFKQFDSRKMNKYIRITICMRKPVLSTPLNSIAFNGG